MFFFCISCPVPEDESKKLKVTMVSWDYTDKWIITAANDYTVGFFFVFFVKSKKFILFLL